MHHALFERAKPIDTEGLMAIARQLELDPDDFAADLADPETERVVARHRRICASATVKGTPSFLVNGELVPGARNVESLRELIDELRESEP